MDGKEVKPGCPHCGIDEMVASGAWACDCAHDLAAVRSAPWLRLIAEERERQITKEGWGLLHDDHHADGSLASAAACYADDRSLFVQRNYANGVFFADAWPWDKRYDKRKKHDRKRQLIIAGALIVAELERLDRAEAIPKETKEQ